jgi:hypothetical protein
MALNTKIAMAAAQAACDAIVDRLDTGGAGVLKIYDGSQPASPDTAVGAQVILAELPLTATAFGAAASNSGKATATAAAITTDTSANATGTASWFRAFNGAGTAIIDGTVGTSGCDLNLNSVAISAGAAVSISAWTFSVPQ